MTTDFRERSEIASWGETPRGLLARTDNPDSRTVIMYWYAAALCEGHVSLRKGLALLKEVIHSTSASYVYGVN